MKKISILGSTGSIGTQTLDVVRAFPDQFKIIGLAAGDNINLLQSQIKEFKPEIVSVRSEQHIGTLSDFIAAESPETALFIGDHGLDQIASHDETQLLVVAITGTKSLKPTYTAIQHGIPIGLACKEVLVAAGTLIMALAKEKGVPILPIDSEHAAVKQCLSTAYEARERIQKIILTASGGPFRTRPLDNFKDITKAEALKHPNWDMGAKITVDSATMMNKGLEVIEAHHLFNVPYERIDVMVHPESVVHSMVEYIDGNVIAQMGLSDMRHPIQYVLSFPKRLQSPWPRLNLATAGQLTFHEPDHNKFPLLNMAIDAGKTGGTCPVVMNAANEAAVSLFLQDKLHFMDIAGTVEKALSDFPHHKNPDLEEIIAVDKEIKASLLHQYA